MKVLFISRSKGENVNPLINNQGASLIKAGLQIDHFIVTGRGIGGYLKSIFKLRKLKAKNKYDVFHAHYSLSGFVASLAGCKPLVVSLMGSDVYYSRVMRFIALQFIRFSWKGVVVKSNHMAETLKNNKAIVLPNGVDVFKYRPIDPEKALEVSHLDNEYKNVLFIADPAILEKNYDTAKKAVELIKNKYKARLITVTKVSNDMIPYFMNAGSVLLLPSLWEGSPNVVKEALACNLPVVATAVGDVPLLISDVDGCYICKNDPLDIASKIEAVLDRDTRINGRKKIEALGLSEDLIAAKLITLYKSVLNV